LTLLDAPQQRLYAVGVYVLLWAWKLYDWLKVVEDGEVSWALFLKWVLIDFAFLFGLPELRIPWLELSQFAVLSAFSAHVILNYFLMFNIPVSPRRADLKLNYGALIHVSCHGRASYLAYLKLFTIANWQYPKAMSGSPISLTTIH
jgi:hypothetical protein